MMSQEAMEDLVERMEMLAIDLLRTTGWLVRHDQALTEGREGTDFAAVVPAEDLAPDVLMWLEGRALPGLDPVKVKGRREIFGEAYITLESARDGKAISLPVEDYGREWWLWDWRPSDGRRNGVAWEPPT